MRKQYRGAQNNTGEGWKRLFPYVKKEVFMREKIERILTEIVPEIDLTCETLIDSGYLESLTLINLISELDIEFNIEIVFADLSVSNFNSVDAIQSLVEAKLRLNGK